MSHPVAAVWYHLAPKVKQKLALENIKLRRLESLSSVFILRHSISCYSTARVELVDYCLKVSWWSTNCCCCRDWDRTALGRRVSVGGVWCRWFIDLVTRQGAGGVGANWKQDLYLNLYECSKHVVWVPDLMCWCYIQGYQLDVLSW